MLISFMKRGEFPLTPHLTDLDPPKMTSLTVRKGDSQSESHAGNRLNVLISHLLRAPLQEKHSPGRAAAPGGKGQSLLQAREISSSPYLDLCSSNTLSCPL